MARKPTIDKNGIIETALKCFLKFGFEETTFQQIAKILKISQPAIYTYFDNKMDLLGECCLWAADKGRTFIDKKINPKDPAHVRFQQYISANFEFFKKYPSEAYAVLAIYFFGLTDPKLRKVHQQMQSVSTDRFEALVLQISYEEGRKLKNSTELALALHNIVLGQVFKIVFEPSSFTSEKENFLLHQMTTLINENLK